jgi:hypothetical protein
MSRSPFRRRRQRVLLATDRAMSPWFRFELEDDTVWVLERLAALDAFRGEADLRTSCVRLAGQLSAYKHCLPTSQSLGYTIRHGLFVSDDDGQVHDIEFDDLLAFRFRLDDEASPDVLHATWHAIVDLRPLLGLHLATGEFRTGIAVGFDIDEGQPLTDPDGSWVHVLPVPLEALNTEEMWTRVRLAMYQSARSLYDDWGHHRLNDGFIDTYNTTDLRSVAYLEEHDGAVHWNTDVVPAFGLERPIVERTRLWFDDDIRRPFRRRRVDATVRHTDDYGYPTRWPDARRRRVDRIANPLRNNTHARTGRTQQ